MNAEAADRLPEREIIAQITYVVSTTFRVYYD